MRCSRLHTYALMLMACVLLTSVAESATPKVSTRRPIAGTHRAGKAETSTLTAATAAFDTIRNDRRDAAPLVRASGYDKPLKSRYETLHLTNLTDSLTILAVGISIEYLDMEGRTLHSRNVEVRSLIPPGQTRLGQVSSWDTQQSFYYIHGRHPRTDRVTPFDINLAIEYVVAEKKKSRQTVDN